MRQFASITVLVLVGSYVSFSFREPGAPVQAVPSREARRKMQGTLEKLPLYFIENRGQLDGRVGYYLQGRETSVYFTSGGVTFGFAGRRQAEAAPEPRFYPASWPGARLRQPEATSRRWVVKLDFVGANEDVEPAGAVPTPAVVSYFQGRPADWKAGLPTYSRVVYANLWPGIDLVYSGTGQKLKYDFVVHPGADPGQIRLAYRGMEGLRVNGAGELEVSTPNGVVRDERPYAYQEEGGSRVEVAAGYRLEGSKGYGFEVGAYDRSRTLVLDPAMVIYAGYIGGAGFDAAVGIAVDGAGNACITGYTDFSAAAFPVTVGPDLTYNGGTDAFVAKVNADGTALVYAGYIGGAGNDLGFGIAVDSAGDAYVTGYTDSSAATFPVTVGPDLIHNGGTDAFVAKVNAGGTALVYAGYIGGAGSDVGFGIAVDGAGNAYVTGTTYSTAAHLPGDRGAGPDP
jgi:hypothetical protein